MADHFRTEAPDWDDLRVFLALAEHRSLSATARALGITHATVSRRVAALEQCLGRPLVDRQAGGYHLTEDGRAVAEAAQPMDQAALAVMQRLDRTPGLSGLVRLTCTRVLADGCVVERLGELGRRHPGLVIEVLTGSRRFSLARREADLALRFGQPADSSLIGRRLATLGAALYASPAIRDRAQAGETVPLIGFDQSGAGLPEAQWTRAAFPGRPLAFRSNSQTAQAQAARAGLGMVLLPHFAAAAHPDLVEVALGPPPPERDLWLLMRADLTDVARVRAVADHLIDMVTAMR